MARAPDQKVIGSNPAVDSEQVSYSSVARASDQKVIGSNPAVDSVSHSSVARASDQKVIGSNPAVDSDFFSLSHACDMMNITSYSKLEYLHILIFIIILPFK